MNSEHLRALFKCHELSWLLLHLNKHSVHWCVNFTVIVIPIYVCVCMYIWASLVTHLVKSLLAMQEMTQFRSLDWGDPLEKDTANHSDILALENPR